MARTPNYKFERLERQRAKAAKKAARAKAKEEKAEAKKVEDPEQTLGEEQTPPEEQTPAEEQTPPEDRSTKRCPATQRWNRIVYLSVRHQKLSTRIVRASCQPESNYLGYH